MAALAYLLLPVSGLIAFFLGGTTRVSFHGAQAVAVGTLWAILLVAGSVLSPVVTRVFFAAGFMLWLVLLVTTAAGRDLRLPLIGDLCERAAGPGPDRP